MYSDSSNVREARSVAASAAASSAKSRGKTVRIMAAQLPDGVTTDPASARTSTVCRATRMASLR